MARRVPVLVILAILGLAQAAFADKVRVFIYSDPAGATVYANQSKQLIGYAPVYLDYEFARDFFKRGRCEVVAPIAVRWASGAEAAVEGVQVCGAAGKNQQLTFVRPPEIPGRETDAFFALQLEQLLAQRLERIQFQEMLGALWRQQTATRQPSLDEQIIAGALNRRTTDCTSTLRGNVVYTSCR